MDEETIIKNFEFLTDFYCIIKNKEDGFYWVLDLNDHPNSFLLDNSFQHLVPKEMKNEQESLVIIQPTIH